MENVPETIYLNLGDDPEVSNSDFRDLYGISWSEQPSTGETIKYVSAGSELSRFAEWCRSVEKSDKFAWLDQFTYNELSDLIAKYNESKTQ